jgi:gamma-glutamyltranspeptidase/glutathione hydrolase
VKGSFAHLRFLVLLPALLCPAGAFAQAASDIAPESASGFAAKRLAVATEAMVVTAHPDATQAALAILRQGGSAADAAITAQLVLGLVEPQSSGLGGGGFVTHYDAETAKVSTLDGRETAPSDVKPDHFLDAAGQPMDFFDAVVGGKAVGVPGTVALLEAMHQRHGKLPWAKLFEPAIALARQGFIVTPRLNALIAESADSLYRQEAARDYFLSEEAVPLFPGARVLNEDYARTLELIAKGGANAFYTGAIAEAITAAVKGDLERPGVLSMDDLARYRVVEREPVCAPYRSYLVCGMGPPSSGGIAIGQILAMAEPFDLAKSGPQSAQTWRIVGDATRLAFADREAFVADPDFVRQPKGLLNRDYLAARRKLLDDPAALKPEAIRPGEPPFDHALVHPAGLTPELPSTSHVSIIDAQGNVVSMTSSIENAFGSRLMVKGFLLNNQLTDFSFVPDREGKPVANRIEPDKRPRSSMAPTIVLKDGKPVLVVGSPGGSRIISYVANAIIGHLDFGLNVQDAVAQPHLSNRFGIYELEAGTPAETLAAPLEALGYSVEIGELNSGLAAIAIHPNRLEGGADPRRDGLAKGY